MKAFFVLIISIIFFSCAGKVEEDKKITNPKYNSPIVFGKNSYYFSVSIDNSFSLNEREVIYSALNEWQEKTNNVFVCESMDFTDISNTSYYPRTILIKKEKLNYPVLGNASYSNSIDGGVIRITIDLTSQYLKTVALHEIGHILKLNHYSGDNYSIMTPTVYSGKDLGCIDLINFCSKWDCISTCNPGNTNVERNVEIEINLENDIIILD